MMFTDIAGRISLPKWQRASLIARTLRTYVTHIMKQNKKKPHELLRTAGTKNNNTFDTCLPVVFHH